MSQESYIIGCIRRLVKNKLTKSLLRRLLMGKIAPIFLYSVPVTYPRNRSEALEMERLNRFVLRIATNDFQSSYMDLLTKTESMPVYKLVLHKRLKLAQDYVAGRRYLPPATIEPCDYNPVLRRRFHLHAQQAVDKTGLRYRDSALELTLQAWNRLPDEILCGNSGGLTSRLRRHSYGDSGYSFVSIEQAILRL